MPLMTLHVEVHGSGWPLVVLPSFGLDHAAMAEAVEPVFTDISAWQRLYVDLPGTGGSAPGDPRSDVVLDEIVETLGAELGDERFAVGGWSYGGYLAAGVTRRLCGQISGLMMVCSGFRIRPQDRDLTGVLGSIPEAGWLAYVPVELHDHLTHAVGFQTAEVASRIAAALRRNGPTDEAYLSSLRADGFALSDETAPSPCNAPVCFLTGQRDRVIGSAGLFRALGLYDRATFTSISGAGHYLPLEQPAVFAAVTQTWLGQCEALLDANEA
jgi:pimeloyl-ACP methyl ester carboxylesterase